MARPIKNNCDYFSHDSNLRSDRKIKALRKKFKEGYSFYCMFLEVLTDCDFNRFYDSEMELEILSGDFDISVAEIRNMIDYCLTINLFSRIAEDNSIHCLGLDKRLKPVYEKRKETKEKADKRLREKEDSF